jgi:hypothetical protein
MRETWSMTEQSPAAGPGPSAAGPDPGKEKSSRAPLIGGAIALIGGALTVGVLMLSSGPTPNTATAPNASDLGIVATADIAAATPTINPSVASQLAAEAKDCKVPLAQLTISKAPGTSGGTIRVRSGNYVSPPFQVTDTPQRVAVPFPAAYPVGKGVISIEGNASGTSVSLYPTWTVQTLNGSAARNVVWTPGNPCR